MATQLNQTSREIYEYIGAYLDTHGISPSIREIAEGCYLGRTTVTRHLERLAGLGYITRIPGVPRSIRLMNLEL